MGQSPRDALTRQNSVWPPKMPSNSHHTSDAVPPLLHVKWRWCNFSLKQAVSWDHSYPGGPIQESLELGNCSRSVHIIVQTGAHFPTHGSWMYFLWRTLLMGRDLCNRSRGTAVSPLGYVVVRIQVNTTGSYNNNSINSQKNANILVWHYLLKRVWCGLRH